MRDLTTPPPPTRIHTPPAPLHGDSYEPYSPPRRTTRASSQRHIHAVPSPPPQPSLLRKSTLHRTTSSQTLSPPSSPEPHRVSHAQQTPARPSPVRRSLFTRERPTPIVNAPRGLDLSLPTPQTMLPTPTKTPQKRDPAALHSTARILNFKPAMLDHVMPSPRRRTKMRLTLDDDESPPQDDIQIYTDTQNRVPDREASEDNPFVGARKTRSKTSRSGAVAGPSRAPPSDSEEAAMEHAVRDDDGLIYVWRGKKIYRRFESPTDVDGADVATSSNARLKRLAGASASRPLTRSSLKPRLLFPSAHQDEEEDVTDVDEEALTDIEEDNMPRPAPPSFESASQELITPAKKLAFQPATPPSSHRQTRSTAKRFAPFADLAAETGPLDFGTPASPSSTPIPQAKAKGKRNASPFDAWQRTKRAEPSHSAAAHGKKRAHASTSGSEEPVTKRTRAAVSHSKT